MNGTAVGVHDNIFIAALDRLHNGRLDHEIGRQRVDEGLPSPVEIAHTLAEGELQLADDDIGAHEVGRMGVRRHSSQRKDERLGIDGKAQHVEPCSRRLMRVLARVELREATTKESSDGHLAPRPEQRGGEERTRGARQSN